MTLPENDYQILKLTDSFYRAYPNSMYKEIMIKRKRAYKEYIDHIKGIKKLHPAEFKRRYQFTALQYFHKELGI